MKSVNVNEILETYRNMLNWSSTFQNKQTKKLKANRSIFKRPKHKTKLPKPKIKLNDNYKNKS